VRDISNQQISRFPLRTRICFRGHRLCGVESRRSPQLKNTESLSIAVYCPRPPRKLNDLKRLKDAQIHHCEICLLGKASPCTLETAHHNLEQQQQMPIKCNRIATLFRVLGPRTLNPKPTDCTNPPASTPCRLMLKTRAPDPTPGSISANWRSTAYWPFGTGIE
jgi:hypothetical protein